MERGRERREETAETETRETIKERIEVMRETREEREERCEFVRKERSGAFALEKYASFRIYCGRPCLRLFLGRGEVKGEEGAQGEEGEVLFVRSSF